MDKKEIHQGNRLKEFLILFKGLGDNSSATPKDSWMGFTVQVGVNKEYDLLRELGTVIRISASGAFRVRISRLVELYKQMCGIDLRNNGLEDLEIVAD